MDPVGSKWSTSPLVCRHLVQVLEGWRRRQMLLQEEREEEEDACDRLGPVSIILQGIKSRGCDRGPRKAFC